MMNKASAGSGVSTRIKFVVSFILLLISFLLYNGAGWVLLNFGYIPFDQLVFHMKVPLGGANTDFVFRFIRDCLPNALLFTCLCLFFAVRWTKNQTVLTLRAFGRTREIGIFPFLFLRRHLAFFSAIMLALNTFYAANILGIPAYFKNQASRSTVFEDYYVDPRSSNISFPEKKRNLIYIFLESMESTFASAESGGAQNVNLIPQLTQLADENINFSSTGLLGGALSMPGTTWTIGGMVAQTTGLPLKSTLNANEYGMEGDFLPGAWALGDILQEQGYNQMLMIGSNAIFGGRLSYFSQHGRYNIWDYFTAINTGVIPEGYFVWWGLEDMRLYENAKEQLSALAAQDAPFNFTMLTVDTHFENGYVCPLCQDTYPDQLSNVISCADRQLGAFISWIQEQDFYEDTTIVIAGDHLYMGTLPSATPENYVRTTYNAFINSPVDTDFEKNRQFSTMDLFPTTLASLGVTFDGDRLAMGTNLFSGTPTLIEELGYEEYAAELDKRSPFYNEMLLK